jgi:capsular polysaccharide biosynthesis protein
VSIIGTVPSPAFAPALPRLINLDGIAERFRDMQLDAFRRAARPAGEVTVHRHRDCWLGPRGVVLAEDGSVLSAGAHSKAEIARAQEAVRQGTDAPVLEGTSVVLKGAGQSTWGHWLVEILPALHVVEPFTEDDHVIVIPKFEPPQREAYVDSARALAADGARIVPTRDMLFRCEEVVLTPDLAETGASVSPLVRAALERITEAVEPRGLTRVFLTRQGLGARRMANFEEVAPVLARHGVTVVAPETLSFREQVAVMGDARLIVGIMGSGLANMCFARPGCHVLALAPSEMFDNFFWRVAPLFELPYWELRCPSVGPERVRNRAWDRDLVVDPRALDHWLTLIATAP